MAKYSVTTPLLGCDAILITDESNYITKVSGFIPNQHEYEYNEWAEHGPAMFITMPMEEFVMNIVDDYEDEISITKVADKGHGIIWRIKCLLNC